MVTEMTNDGKDIVEKWKQQEQERKAEYQKAKDLQARIQEERRAVKKWYVQARSLWRRSPDHSPVDYIRIDMCYYERIVEAHRKYLGNGEEKT